MDIRQLALNPLKNRRHKDEVVPEWDNAKVIVCEPSIAAWHTGLELSKDDSLTATQKDDVIVASVLIDVLRDQGGEQVFKAEDIDMLQKIIGKVHRRLFNLSLSLAEINTSDDPVDIAEKK